jgi:hypothetical protein
MNQNTRDQELEQLQLQLQFRIDKLVGNFLKDDFLAIEYKTLIAGLLQSPPKYNEQNVEEIS